MKLFFLTSQLQAFKFVETFPWLFIFFGKIKRNITKTDILIGLIYFFYIIYGLFISTDTLSFMKVFAFMSLSFLASRISLNNYSNINSKNFYIFILIGLIIEDILIKNFGIFSPFVRDTRGAFFLFQEKSYFVLIFFSIISFSRKIKYSHFFYLFFIGIFLESGLFWIMFFGLLIYKFIRNYNENFINYLFIVACSIFYIVLNLIADYTLLISLFGMSDILRPLINLTSINASCIGTFYLQDCIQNKIIIDLSQSYFATWDGIMGQSAFFLLYNFFGVPGILFIIFYVLLILKKIKHHKNRGFIFFNVLIQLFLQGFLLSPTFFWVLALREQKFEKK